MSSLAQENENIEKAYPRKYVNAEDPILPFNLKEVSYESPKICGLLKHGPKTSHDLGETVRGSLVAWEAVGGCNSQKTWCSQAHNSVLI
ncbi:Hypothetical predicted protein [Octopus vulgaris]|uniref:Uncharacterized protein n=1 Tax=Octopus vulgaris TaxID=6645 RepID=A0AA36AFL9_OCTVU|nr:Hypothetical predicted protein [Octopus vulgaris]